MVFLYAGEKAKSAGSKYIWDDKWENEELLQWMAEDAFHADNLSSAHTS